MMINVIICTYNRGEMLRTALESVAASAVPPSVEWDVLVVDNNSTDKTRDVVDEFCLRYPGRFRYLLETQQGLSHARNAGIRESRGDVLVFTDDDITVDGGWLWALSSPLLEGECAGTGGRVTPVWKCPPPRWFPIEHPWASIVQFDLGSDAGPLFKAPLGANMAFRKGVFEKHGGFRTDLGRCADSLLSNEDVEFGRRLLSAGERLRYEPSAVVRHPVAEDRLRKQYILDWWFGKARSDVRDGGIPPETKWFVVGIPLYMFRRLGMGTLRWIFSIKPSRRFYYKLCLWHSAGAIVECYGQGRQASGRKTMPAETARP
jgi:glucosyl-dolichyl phosphate glucuronosyltransferase